MKRIAHLIRALNGRDELLVLEPDKENPYWLRVGNIVLDQEGVRTLYDVLSSIKYKMTDAPNADGLPRPDEDWSDPFSFGPRPTPEPPGLVDKVREDITREILDANSRGLQIPWFEATLSRVLDQRATNTANAERLLKSGAAINLLEERRMPERPKRAYEETEPAAEMPTVLSGAGAVSRGMAAGPTVGPGTIQRSDYTTRAVKEDGKPR